MGARKPAAATAIVASAVLIVLSTAGLVAPPLSYALVVNDASAPFAAGVASGPAIENNRAPTTFYAHEVGATQKPQPGDYPLKRRRNRMLFWHRLTSWTHRGSPLNWIIALPLALLGIGVLPAVFLLRRWLRRKGRDAGGFVGMQGPSGFAPSSSPTADVATNDRLRRLSDLHASGALTDAEFESEKRRIVGGG